VSRFLLALLVSGFLGIAFIGCEKPSEPSILDVKYQVIGSAVSFDITYRVESGELYYKENISPPWSYTFQTAQGDTIYVSAQNHGETGSVCARVWREGEICKSSTCTGAHCTATASGTL
jgi:hypothetical protein